MKNSKKFYVVLCGVCTLIWLIRIVLDIVEKTYIDKAFLFWLNVACAVLWLFTFVLNLKTYLSKKDK